VTPTGSHEIATEDKLPAVDPIGRRGALLNSQLAGRSRERLHYVETNLMVLVTMVFNIGGARSILNVATGLGAFVILAIFILAFAIVAGKGAMDC